MIEGQISIFDWLAEADEKKEDPTMLSPGQKVWMVIKGDIQEYKVTDEAPWNYTGRLVYRLQQDNGLYWTLPVNELGSIFFLDCDAAQKKANEYFNVHTDVIFAHQIKPVETKVYSYIRDCDGRELFSYYAILPDGKVYVKKFMEYEHIVAFNSVENARESMKTDFFRQQAFQYASPQEKDIVPTFKNMYRCKNDSGWLYATAWYGRCI